MQPFYIIVFLILFPLVLAVSSLVFRSLSVRRMVAVPANVLIAIGTLLILGSVGSDPLFFKVESALSRTSFWCWRSAWASWSLTWA